VRVTAIMVIDSLALFGLRAAASAQSGPPGPACHLWGDALAASATALQLRIPSFLRSGGGAAEQNAGLPLQLPGRWWLRRFLATSVEVTPLTMRTFFVSLQGHSPSHQHRAWQYL